MTYARARLWIGMCGVGSVVSLSALALSLNLPTDLLPTGENWALVDLASLSALFGFYVVLMTPFDFMGGYFLPNRFDKSVQTLRRFFWHWMRGVSVQSVVYIAITLALLACGRSFGVTGCLAFLLLAFVTFLVSQSLMYWLVSGRKEAKVDLDHVKIDALLAKWKVRPLPIRVVDNQDPGFTGGVVGLPYFESIVIGESWSSRLTSEELATVIARRCVAVSSGARTRGLLIAMAWILFGFAGSSLLPFAGVASVAELITALLGFTLWTFVGLLVLPTISRQAAYAIDALVVSQGVSESALSSTLTKLDREQDDEASRTALVETIFHPVPSVTNRGSSKAPSRHAAWHAARMTLFLSWSCAGLLSRAVHCNVGRPELWIMLPTD